MSIKPTTAKLSRYVEIDGRIAAEDGPAIDLASKGMPQFELHLVLSVLGERNFAYDALYHLLPLCTLRRYRLPIRERGVWPSYPVADACADRADVTAMSRPAAAPRSGTLSVTYPTRP